MDETYIEDIYNNLGGQEKFGSFEDFKTLISTDDSYISDFHSSFGEEVLGSLTDFSKLVKKKDEPTELVSEPEEEVTTVVSEEVEEPGVAESLPLKFDPSLSPRAAMKPTDAPSMVADVSSVMIEGDLTLKKHQLQKQREVEQAVAEAAEVGIEDISEKFSSEEHKKKLKAQKEAKEQKAEREKIVVGDTEFQELLLNVNEDLIGSEEDVVVPQLREKFSQYGFVFETAGIGDAVSVTTQDGEHSITIDLDPFLSSTESSESKKLRDFIAENRIAEKIEGEVEEVKAAELLEEDALEKYRKNFFAQRGLDYGTVTEAQNEIARLENQNALIDEVKELEYRDPTFEGVAQDVKEQHPEIFTPDGKLRGDVAAIRAENIEKLEKLSPLAFVEDVQQSKEAFDATLLKFREDIQTITAEVNQDVNTQLKNLNDQSLNLFGTTLSNIPKILPTQAEVDMANDLFIRHAQLTNRQQLAADQYYNSKIFYDYQENKNAQKEYAGQWEGFVNQIKSGYAQGKAADEIFKITMGLTDPNDPIEQEEAARQIALLMAEQQGLLSSQAVARFNGAKSFQEALDVFLMDPLEIATGLAANSLSMMLPIGTTIIPTAVGAGVATGATVASVVPGAGTAAGALTGAGYGFKTGFATTSFFLEYTNSILDAMREEGYDLTKPQEVEQALTDKKTWDKGREIGMKRGLAIGLVDFMGASLAGKLVKPLQKPLRKATMIGVETVAVQPGFEALGELGAQVLAGQKISGQEIFAEAVGAMGHQTPNLGLNIYMKTNKSSKIKLAEKLTKPEFVVAQSEGGAAIASWANDMNEVGLISDQTNNKIQENAALKEKTETLYEPSLKEKLTPKILSKKNKIKERIFELLKQRQQYEKNPDIFSSNIKDINEEINTIVTTKTIPEAVVAPEVEVTPEVTEEVPVDAVTEEAVAEPEIIEEEVEVAPEVKEEEVGIEVSEKELTQGKEEAVTLTEGTITTANPIKIFKGIGGKKDLEGIRINAHKGAEGVFASVEEEQAAEYGREEGVAEVVIPQGTTVEVVEVDGTGLTPEQYRQAEVAAINESDAQVIKLITVEGILKKGQKKQEQYIIKDETLIKEIAPVTEEVVEAEVEVAPDEVKVKEEEALIDRMIRRVKKIREEMDEDGFKADIFAGLTPLVIKKTLDITITTLEATKSIAQAIDAAYKYLVDNNYKGTKKQVEEYIREKVGEKKTYAEKQLERQKEEGMFIPGEKRYINSLRSLIKKLFSARKHLPKSVFAFQEKKDAMIASSLKSVEYNVQDFNRLSKKYIKDNKLTKPQQDKLVSDFDAYLRGDKKVEIPEELKEVANTMRNQIDYLSKQLINIGLTKESQVKKVRANIGQYLHRSYEVYDNKNWRTQVQEEVKQTARNFLREQMRPLAEEVAKKTEETTDQALDRLVDNEMEKMLDKEGANNFLTAKGSKIGTKDISILKQREDIPFEIRALMGEYKDPMQNYARTILKLTSLVNNAKFLNQVKEAGMGTFFFEKGDAPKGYTHKIAADKTATYDPLGGLYTSPEIAADMSKVGREYSKALERYMKVLSVTKWNKTIGSVGTHAKNVLGNLGFVMANGHYDVTEMYNAYMTIRRDLFPERKGVTKLVMGELTPEQKKIIKDKFKKYLELGLVDQSAGLGEIRDMFKAANFDEALVDRLSNKKLNLAEKAKRLLLRGKKRIEDYYQAEDDFFKIVAYENELSRYAKAEFGKNKKDLTPEELSQIDQKVADIIKNVYPTYSRVPEIIRRLKVSPLVGNFVSFQAESYRTAFNTVDIAFKELKSDNPKIRKIGAQRLTGILSYLSAKTSLITYFSMAAGTGMSGVLGYLWNNEEEEEREKDFRRFVASWTKKSDVIILQASDGKLRYIDMSSSDPHGGMNKALNAFLSGENPVDAFTKGLVQLIEPFVGWDITTAALLDLEKNKDNYGKDIYNPEEGLKEIAADVLTYMWTTIEPGTVSSGARIYDAEEVTPELLSMMTGFRIYETDIAKQVGYNSLDIKRNNRLTNARKIYNSVAYKDESTQEEKEKAYNKANRAMKKIYQEVLDDYNAAIRLGADPKIVAENIKSFGGISKGAMKYITKGLLPEYEVPGKKKRTFRTGVPAH